MSLPVSIRVRILDREYPLRVAPATRTTRSTSPRASTSACAGCGASCPAQPDMTHAVLVALELAEELYAARAETDRLRARLEIESAALTDRLDAVLSGDGGGESRTDSE